MGRRHPRQLELQLAGFWGREGEGREDVLSFPEYRRASQTSGEPPGNHLPPLPGTGWEGLEGDFVPRELSLRG